MNPSRLGHSAPFFLLAACGLFGCPSGSNDVAPDAGGNPDGKPIDAQCVNPSDCQSGVCESGICAAPVDAPPSHADGRKNLDETDVDCGGTTGAPACANGKGCLASTDCVSVACVANVCADPTATDGVKDGTETDIDCGGGAPTNAPACVPGKGCLAATDCDSKVCGADGKCAAPTATDGVQNGDETDIDCGGTTTSAPKCALNKSCKVHADCASDGCNFNGKCIAIKSCAQHHGGDTCGPTGTDDCCTTLPVSGYAGTLDKYNVTAGRFRQFVERTNGDLRTFAQGYTGSWWNHAWDAFLPTMLDNGGTNPDGPPSAFTGVYQEVGPNVHGDKATGANEGCWIMGFGARTFRIPDTVNARMNDVQLYTQEVDDERPMNCVSALMVAAFCAWDGGKMPSRQEIDQAWNNGAPASYKYPWGNTPDPAGYAFAYPTDPNGTYGKESFGPYQTGPFVLAPFATTNLQYANYNFNFWGGATLQEHDPGTGTPDWGDYSLLIAPPGRFPAGNSVSGHADLAGGVFNSTDITSAPGNLPKQAPFNVYWSRSGSWQGHPIPFTPPGTWLQVPASYKYWAMGGRCAR